MTLPPEARAGLMRAWLSVLSNRHPGVKWQAASFTCPRCGRTSYNPNDIGHGYCGACHDWTG